MITVWHNPKCSKSREAIKLLEEKGADFGVVKYLEETPGREEIESLLKKLGISARELMRTKEELYKELALAKVTDEAKLIDALVAHPRLIERPVLPEEIGRSLDQLASGGRGLRVYRDGKPYGFWEPAAQRLEAGDKVVEVIGCEESEAEVSLASKARPSKTTR